MPQIRIRDAGNVLRTPTRIRIRDASNVLRTVQRIRIRDAGNVLRTVFQAFQISASTTSIVANRTGAGILTSGTVTITATGAGPFTYSWAKTTGATSPNQSATAPSSNITAFTATFVGIADVTSTWRCTATDTGTGAVLTVDVLVELIAN